MPRVDFLGFGQTASLMVGERGLKLLLEGHSDGDCKPEIRPSSDLGQMRIGMSNSQG